MRLKNGVEFLSTFEVNIFYCSLLYTKIPLEKCQLGQSVVELNIVDSERDSLTRRAQSDVLSSEKVFT